MSYFTMKVISFYFLIIAIACSSLWQKYGQFQNYIKEYHKTYQSKTVQIYRFAIYLRNLQHIAQLNLQDQASGVYGQTVFTDLTPQEMHKMYATQVPSNLKLHFIKNFTNDPHYEVNVNTPEIWNWAQQGAVTEVKDQGTCGSCWSFSTVGNIEGQYFLKTKQLINFSEQQLVDCDKSNFGCSGGWPYAALDWIAHNGGLMTFKDYPLRTNYSGPCQFDKAKAKAQVKGYLNVTRDQAIIKDALYEVGPLSIALDFEGMFHYKGGVASPLFCSTWPNHALVLVGYGVKDEDYWLIKNSWGPKWGLNGYLMLKRGVNKCGVGYWATTAILN